MERPVQKFEDESNKVRVITRESSWDDISMHHHHTVNMSLVKTKLLQNLFTTTRYKR